jgi:hypothetical protein
MRHTCPDGTQSKLTRTGPVGTIEGVVYSCAHCGYSKSAVRIMADTLAVKDKIVAALAR